MTYSDYIHEQFPKHLIETRNALGLSQSDVAKAINKPLRTYQRYEYGDRMPPLDIALAISHALQTPLDVLAGNPDFPPYNEVEK